MIRKIRWFILITLLFFSFDAYSKDLLRIDKIKRVSNNSIIKPAEGAVLKAGEEYEITIYGNPSGFDSWNWRLHLIYQISPGNYFVGVMKSGSGYGFLNAKEFTVTCNWIVQNLNQDADLLLSGEFYYPMPPGGREIPSHRITVHIDNNIPSINLYEPSGGFIINGKRWFDGRTLSFNYEGWDGTDINKVEMWQYSERRGVNTMLYTRSFSGIQTHITSSYSWTPSESANYQIWARIYDSAGNYKDSTRYHCGIDKETPAVHINSPVNNSWYKGNATLPVTISGSDPYLSSGLKGMDLLIDGSVVKTFTTTSGTHQWDVPNITRDYTIQANIYDNVNRSGTDSINVKIDTLPPIIAGNPIALDSQDGFYSGSALTWIWDTAIDTPSGIKEYKVLVSEDDSTIHDWVSTGTTLSFTHPVSDGKTYACQYKAIDQAGNETISGISSVIIDSSVEQVALPDYPISYDDGTALFRWEPITSEINANTYYEVAITEDTTPPAIGLIDVTEAQLDDTWSYVFEGLSAANTYYAWVRGVDWLGNKSEWTTTNAFLPFIVSGPYEDVIDNFNPLVFKLTPRYPIVGDELKFKIFYRKVGILIPDETEYSGAYPASTISLQNLDDGDWEWWSEVVEYKEGESIPESSQIIEKSSFIIDAVPPNVCSFNITSLDGIKEYSTSLPSNNRQVRLSNIKLSDSSGGYPTGIRGVTVWNGEPDIIAPNNAYYLLANIPADGIVWNLQDEEEGVCTINMLAEDYGSNTLLCSKQLTLDFTPPGDPANFAHTNESDKIIFKWESAEPNDDLVLFKGNCTLPDNSTIPIEVTPNSDKEGTFEIDISSYEPNQPVAISIYGIDIADNQSQVKEYTAYTLATLGEITFNRGYYNITTQRHTLEWSLTDTQSAAFHKLEYGELSGNEFTVQGSITPNADSMFVLDSIGDNNEKLQPHATYHFRLAVYNTSLDSQYGDVFSQTVPNIPPIPAIPLSPLTYGKGSVDFQYSPAIDYDKDPLTHSIYLGEGSEPLNFISLAGNHAEGLNDGKYYTWYVTADDTYSGHTDSGKVTFMVDTINPELNVSEPRRPYTNQTELAISAMDGASGIERVTVQKILASTNEVLPEEDVVLLINPDGSSTGMLALSEGSYHLIVKAYDKAGNQTVKEINNLRVDRTDPVISDIQFLLPQSGSTYLASTRQVPVEFNCTDDFSGASSSHISVYKISTDELIGSQTINLSSNLEVYRYMIPLPGEDGLSYKFGITCSDRAGNMTSTQYIQPVLLDSTSPVGSIHLEGKALKQYNMSYYLSDLSNINLILTGEDPDSGITMTEYNILDNDSGNFFAGWNSLSTVKQTVLTDGKQYSIAARLTNGVGAQTIVMSSEFTYDQTPPAGLTISGPSGPLVSGEMVYFNVTVNETDTPIKEFRLAIGSDLDTTKLSSLLPGNESGWISLKQNSTTVRYKVVIPDIGSGTYKPTVEATNACGLSFMSTGSGFDIINTDNRMVVSDQGPFTMFDDHLTGWWRYAGTGTILNYRYRITKTVTSEVVYDWHTTSDTTVTVTGLNLESGIMYRFEVQAQFDDGTYSTMGMSPGITVDTTAPMLTEFTTPIYSTSNDLRFTWEGNDDESGIIRVQAALGSNYNDHDMSKGWMDVSGNTVQLTFDVNGDNLSLSTGNKYYLSIRLLNQAGGITEVCSSAVTIDDTLPPVPLVYDQGDYINTYQPLKGNWIWSETDPESGTSFEWALIESPSEIGTTSWTQSNINKTIVMNEPVQEHGKTYYFAVRATNGSGLISIGLSNGIMADATAPYIPEIRLIEAVNLGNPDAAELNYITSTQNLGLWIDSTDPEAPVDGYLYAYGPHDEVEGYERTESDDENIELINPEIPPGEVTFFAGECTNLAELVSLTGYSNGTILDTNTPIVTNVRGTVSGNKMLFDWNVIESVSPVAGYQVSLVREEDVNLPPQSWIDTGINRNVIIETDSLTDGRYCLIVRAFNAAGAYSRREQDIDEWGVSPPITLDRVAPTVEIFTQPQYVSDSLALNAQAGDNLAGIEYYQYAFGTISNPYEFTDGWIDVDNNSEFLSLELSTAAIPHNINVCVLLRVRDRAGLWSNAVLSGSILVDHTIPSTPAVTNNPYTTRKNEINGIQFTSSDPESGITHYCLGIAAKQDGSFIKKVTAPINEFAGQLSGLDLTEGVSYYVFVQTQNGAGEWSETGYGNPITVDTLKPILTFTHGSDELVLNHPPLDVEYSVTEAGLVTIVLTGQDGTSTTSNIPVESGSHTFTFTEKKPQVYTLSAYAEDTAGNRGDPDIQQIRVNNPPTVNLAASFNVAIGALFTYSATASDTDGTIAGWEWDPGDSTPVLPGSSPTHTYTEKGLYTITLTVTDNDGGETTATSMIMVGNTNSGPLSVDEVWSGIHRIYGDVTVPAHLKLTIMPGTQVIVDGTPETGYFHGLFIEGELIINTPDTAAVFTSVTGDASGWKGIIVSGKASITGVEIHHAQRGIAVLNGSQVTVSNSSFIGNFLGIHVFDAEPEITGCLFNDNAWYGIKEDSGGRPKVVDCTFSGNRRNYYHNSLTSITIEQLNTIDSNSGNKEE